jgi:hypothetical protein
MSDVLKAKKRSEGIGGRHPIGGTTLAGEHDLGVQQVQKLICLKKYSVAYDDSKPLFMPTGERAATWTFSNNIAERKPKRRRTDIV